jgi:S-adenosylmethionine decarboxylase
MTSYTSTVYQDESSNPPFEGPEKLLEIWFAPSEEFLEKAGNPEGLRVVKKETWEKKVLDLVRCKVMSVIEGEDLDAYLLRWAMRRRLNRLGLSYYSC